MKVTMEFIDNKGKWHVARANSKKKAVESFKALHPETEIHWTKKDHVVVSQQYIKEGEKC